jgi:hypothetical protein
MTFYLPFLTFRPRIRERDDKLVASTSYRVWLLTLGLSNREVVIDPDRKEAILRRRRFWFWRRRRVIPFDRIKSVTYRYADSSVRPFWGTAGSTFDIYTVGLRLHDFSDVHLFSFFGEGEFENRSIWPDWFYWQEAIFGVSGTQARESRAYAEVLMRMIGVSLT